MLKVLILTIILSQGSNIGDISATANNGTNFYRSPNTTRYYPIINKNDNNISNSNANDNTASFVERNVPKTPTDRGSNVKAVVNEPAPNIRSYERHLDGSSIIFGLAKTANESNLNTRCYQALKSIEQSILHREPWAMKVLDASGTKPAGFIFGQNFWLGSREACGAVQQPIGITLSRDYDYQRIMKRSVIEDLAPFDMDYRVLYMRHHSPWQVEIKLMSERIIHIGLCLPSSCSAPEIHQLAEEYVKQGSYVEADLYDVHPEVLYMKDLKLNESFYQKKSLRLFVAFVIFTCLMLLSASLLSVKPNTETEEKKRQHVSDSGLQTEMKSAKSALETKDSPTTEIAQPNTKPLDVDNFESLKKFVKCYDLNKNCEKLFATRENSVNEIPVINGLRSISAIWIMLFHVLWYMYFTVDNKPFMISHAERVFFQYVSSAPLLVDVFFTISGFLQTYNFLRNAKQMEIIRRNNLWQNVRHFFKLVFHRYLRLAPLYFVIMGVVDLLSAYVHDVSVFHIHDRFDRICSQHWWRNVIFIQNLFSHQDLCVNWTWSLACEMQFFVLATILLFVYAKHPNFTKKTVVAALISTACWSYFIGMSSKFQLSFDVTFATGTEIYINPFVRILPYILGTIAGWYFMEHKHDIELSPLKEKCLWNLAILIFFCCIYSTYRRDFSYLSSITLFVFGRLLFSLAVCWMIIGSATGRSSWWSRFLEAKVFQHVNRLTYAIYLINPFIIALVFSLTETSTHVDPLMLCVLASGFAVIVYLTSIVFSLVFEMPYCNWSSQILRRGKQKVA